MAGNALAYLMQPDQTFCRRTGYYWRGNERSASLRLELAAVHALQALALYVPPTDEEDTGYRSFQLNLVLQDGNRLNVLAHSNRIRFEAQVHALADFLGLPLWSGHDTESQRDADRAAPQEAHDGPRLAGVDGQVDGVISAPLTGAS